MDRNFEDLLEGQDYVSTHFSENLVGRSYNSIKLAAGLSLMMAEVIGFEKIFKHAGMRRAGRRELKNHPELIPPQYAHHPEEREPSPRKWAK